MSQQSEEKDPAPDAAEAGAAEDRQPGPPAERGAAIHGPPGEGEEAPPEGVAAHARPTPPPRGAREARVPRDGEPAAHGAPAAAPAPADEAEIAADLADGAAASEAASEPPDDAVDGAALAAGELRSVLESLLLVSDKPLSMERLKELCAAPSAEPLRQALTALQREYLETGRGFQLHEVAGGFQLRTAPKNAAFVQRLLQQKPVRLSRAQLETLAIVAYRQPITRPEIDDIRGVDSGGTLKVLLERNLLRVLGKKEEPGRPLLYGTTREFLEFFNLRDLRDLPTLREFYELSEEHQAQVNAMGGALEEAEAKRPEPAAPPPLTRVELKDLQLGDDEEELSRIDGMIQEVRTDFQLDVVLQQAELIAGVKPAPPPAAPPAEDDREPEEL